LVMLEYQQIIKSEKIAKRNNFNFVCFRSGLKEEEVTLILASSCNSLFNVVVRSSPNSTPPLGGP